MDLNHLKTFVAVAEEGHLTRAAERLFTSQPAVSAQLKALEEALGVSLFDRTPKGMRLTAAGEQLLVKAKNILDSAGALLAEAKALQGDVIGELALGINSDCAFLKIPALLARLNERHPHIHLSLNNSMSPDILLDIRKGRLDGGYFFGRCTTADLHVLPLATIESSILAPVAWADKVENACLEDLAQLPWIYSSARCPFVHIVEEMLGTSVASLTKVVYADNEDAIREFVKAGYGIAFLRADDAERAQKEGWGVRWQGETLPIKLSAAVQTQRQGEPIVKAWLNLLPMLWPDIREATLSVQSA